MLFVLDIKIVLMQLFATDFHYLQLISMMCTREKCHRFCSCRSVKVTVILSVSTEFTGNEFTAIILVDPSYPASPVKNWRTLLEQSFTAHLPLLMASSTFGVGRRC